MAIYKISAGEALDAWYDADPEEALAYASDLLSGAATESIRGAAETFVEDDHLPFGAVNDLQEHWLSGFDGVPGDDVDRVLRLGYREAIAIAQEYDPPAPIESFWVTGPGTELGVHISAVPQRVLVFISTPVARRYGSYNATSRSWTVRIGDITELDPDAPREALDDGPDPVLKIQVSGQFDAAS
ncbi:MAG: hypothetical protein ACXW1S_02890 [Acidimicrobiia bacterium]